MSGKTLIEVKKIANGYMLEVYKPIPEEKAEVAPYDYSCKNFYAKDDAAVLEAITALLPILAQPDQKEEFDTYFEEMTND
jgi:hypothetical protein